MYAFQLYLIIAILHTNNPSYQKVSQQVIRCNCRMLKQRRAARALQGCPIHGLGDAGAKVVQLTDWDTWVGCDTERRCMLWRRHVRTLGGGAPPGARGGAGDAFWNSVVASAVPHTAMSAVK